MKRVDVAVIGAGIGGMAAAISCKRRGLSVLLVEKERVCGGILWQCIHTGFGASLFGKELTGPEFAEYFIQKMDEEGVECMLSCHLLSFEGRELLLLREGKEERVWAKVIVFATGARERTRIEARIHGGRPAGVFTAGQVQRFLNVDGVLPGKKIVIVGGGDVGLIVARHLMLEGADVVALIERQRFIAALPRNILFSIHDFGIPVHLGAEVVSINGERRVESVTVRKDGTIFQIPADTVILSLGLLPDVGLLQEKGVAFCPHLKGVVMDTNFLTSLPSVFVCGNCALIYEVVDDIVEDAERVAEGVKIAVEGRLRQGSVKLLWSAKIAYCVPQLLHPGAEQRVYLRVKEPMEEAVFLMDEKIVQKVEHVTPNQLIKLNILLKEEKEKVFLDIQ